MPKKILVVDDDESITEVIQITLEGEGYQVETSLDGCGIPGFPRGVPDLILLDVLLLGKDGREICKQLKQNASTAAIPVIMLSAHSDADKLAGIGSADDFLEKPFDVDVLIDTVAKHLRNSETRRADYEGTIG
ncbi:MAG TPA: response regulator [Ktedonobacteraceae bacterium]|nr:response regulator [Ktedonobacteraceae bacterium]